MSKIIINQNQFSDLLNIKYKVFYPLKTFVNKEQFLRILKKCQYEDKFFPSCLPYIFDEITGVEDNKTRFEARKYYHPLRGFTISTAIYDRILCYATTEGIEKCLEK